MLITDAENYIFDLYGTLIDIHTDEKPLEVWKQMAAFYQAAGADYKAGAMRTTYRRLWQDEKKRMCRELGHAWPEVSAARVFARLILEAPVTRKTSLEICGVRVSDLRQAYMEDKPEANLSGTGLRSQEDVTELIASSDWMKAMTYTFRVLVREKYKLYPGTIETIQALKGAGKKLYLLSNAQHEYTVPEMEELGLYDLFDGILISSDERIKKPCPAFMERLLDRYGLDRDSCVMIGNEIESDCKVAALCGMKSVYLNTWHFSGRKVAEKLQEHLQGTDPACEPILIMDGKITHLIG